MHSPIIPWIGGKRRLAKTLLPLFPEHDCYVEPFAGGAAMFFLRPSPAKVEVLNDMNSDLVNLYRVVQHHLEELVRQFKWALISREMFKWLKITPLDTLTDIQRAARFFYMQHMAFGAKVADQSFGTATTSKPGLNLLRIEEALSAAHLRLAQVFIEHLPWQEVVKRYDRAHTFFFMDPPYWQTAGYGESFPWEEYEQLATAIASMKGKSIVTLNNHPDIRKLFKGFNVRTAPIRYTVGGGAGSQASELIIQNWK
ncbi:DNA adenine methylase [Paracandidimonas soli]|uniref:site-specific DNA-methyltransferase (adenine-specific) n=1 Tax=Paracandidimonas soli TaxID=1917182 RepID=A0A4R3VAK0_9BURK|nr:DNA adenine methylase [Paracandidimonas soli]TCV00519.1 DNA adenine methylase [Paracandidimonas soli]